MRDTTRLDHGIGLGIAAAYVAWLYRTARILGFSRDESFYFDAAGRYAAWFHMVANHQKGATERGTIDQFWSTNHEHPSLVKSLFALSWMVFHEKSKYIADSSQALRLPGMLMGGLALYVTYLFGVRLFSRTAGIAGAAALALMPQVFYHAHLACFDVAAMAMWALAIYAYFCATEKRTLGWALWAGVAYGLLLETKHNAWIMPAVVLPHALYTYRTAGAFKGIQRFPLPVLAMAVLGPLVFVGLWPWLWNDTEARIREYAAFHLNHEYYNMEYFGRNYNGPPSPPSYAPVMIAASVPTVTLVLFGLGLVGFFRRLVVERVRDAAAFVRRLGPPAGGYFAQLPEGGEVLLFLGLMAPIAVFFLPKTPIFGGTKHWFPAYPLLCVFVGHGFDQAVRAFQARFTRLQPGLPAALLGLAAFTAPALETAHSHPFGISAYVPLVGGTRGGATLGFNRQFWGYTTEGLAGFFQSTMKPGESVYIHDTTMGAFQALQNEGRIRADIRGNAWSISDADYAIVHHELHMIESEVNIWTAYDTAHPVYVLEHDGVPFISVYRRRK